MNTIRDARNLVELMSATLRSNGMPPEYLETHTLHLVGCLSDMREWLQAARLQDQNRSLEERLERLARDLSRAPILASVDQLPAFKLGDLLTTTSAFVEDFAHWVETAAPAPTGNVIQFRRPRPPFISAVIEGGAA